MAHYPHVVVLIPGILGSVLTKDGKPVWDFNLLAVVGALTGSTLESLALSEPGSLEDDLGDGIRVHSLLANIEAVPGLWKIGGYTRLLERLEQYPGLQPGVNLFAFPYDWRRDNRVAANRLKLETEGWLAEWREKTNNPHAKLVILAHSMGGLVSAYYTEVLGGWKDTRTLVNIGVPFRGAGNPLNFLANGITDLPFANKLTGAAAAFATMDSLYQLLPLYPFIKSSGRLSKVVEHTLPGVDPTRAAEAVRFHDEISNARSANKRIADHAGMSVRNVVGFRQGTAQSAEMIGSKLVLLKAEHDGVDASGDGTVARVSATPVGETEDNAMFVANAHPALPADEVVFDHISAILAGNLIDLEKYRFTVPHDTISIALPDLADADKPIRLIATATSNHQYLVAHVYDTSDAKVTERHMYPQNGIYCADVELTPGLYRVSISGGRASPVSDVLAVLNPS